MNSRGELLEEHVATLKSPYSCPKCGEGTMIPAIQEGEPDYTDNYLCNHCHFHDNIPTAGIISSQILTSVFGAIVCLFIFQDYVIAADANAKSQSITTALGSLIAVLCVGFSYVFYKAVQGIVKRKRYQKITK